jgi:hypothetical protein
MNTGVARVAGKVKLDTNDLDASVFNLSIFPADDDWRHALSPEGTLPPGYVPDATDQTLVTFKSTRILSTGDGELEVIGDLTLNRLERTIITTQTDACAGRVGGVPVIRNEAREIMFLFPSVSAAHLSGPLTPSMLQKKGVLEIVGSARVDREEFPELLTAMKETKWPPVVQKKGCHIPFTGGEAIAEPDVLERWSQELAMTTVTRPPPWEKTAAPSALRRRVTKQQLFWT